MDSRRKGNVNENQVCRALSRWLGPPKADPAYYDDCLVSALPFRRRTTSITPTSGGWEGGGDILHVAGAGVVCPFTIECKDYAGWELDGLMYRSKIDPWGWWEQAKGQTVRGHYPLLVFTRNWRPVYAMMQTKVAQCLQLRPKEGPLLSVARPSGEAVTACLLADLTATDRKLVGRLVGPSNSAKAAS